MFPYTNSYWADVEYSPLCGTRKYGALIFPNMARIIELSTGAIVEELRGEDFKARAKTSLLGRLERWDNHVNCCWLQDVTYVLKGSNSAEATAGDAPEGAPKRRRKRKRSKRQA